MQEDTTKPTAGDFDADFVTTVGDTVGIIAEEGKDAGAGDFDFCGGSAGFFFEGEGTGGGGEVLNGEVEVATELSDDVGAVEIDVDTGAGQRGDGVVNGALQLVHVQCQRAFQVKVRQSCQCDCAAIGADGEAGGQSGGLFNDQAESGIVQFDSEFPCLSLIDSEERID